MILPAFAIPVTGKAEWHGFFSSLNAFTHLRCSNSKQNTLDSWNNQLGTAQFQIDFEKSRSHLHPQQSCCRVSLESKKIHGDHLDSNPSHLGPGHQVPPQPAQRLLTEQVESFATSWQVPHLEIRWISSLGPMDLIPLGFVELFLRVWKEKTSD